MVRARGQRLIAMLGPSLSTMWMQLRHASLLRFLEEARAMGFESIELSPVVTRRHIAELDGTARAAVRVVHHPCPDIPTLPPLCDLHRERRRVAIESVLQTLDLAQTLGAQAIVLHLGEVALDRRWENALRARWLQGDVEGLHRTYQHLWAMRQSQAAAHLDAARYSLAALLPAIAGTGIELGIETGEWLFSLPTPAEATTLLADFGPPLGLWIDTGHVTILERLGGPTLHDWLRLAPDRLAGLHYHDVNGLRDHLIPGRGTIEWETVAPLVPPSALPTCELDWYYSSAEIVEGVARLAAANLISWPER